MSESKDNEKRDRRVLELYEKILEVEQRLIPTGLHVFGRPSNQSEIADLLRMVASFDRPELEIRSLPDLVTEGLGLPSYSELLNESSNSEQRLREREKVEAIVSQAITLFTNEASKGAKAFIEFLKESASVPEQESNRIFTLLSDIRARLDTSNELDGLVRALRGEYVEPGPGADIIQNPNILPPGRNTHAVNPYSVPSATAVRRAEPVVNALIDRNLKEAGRYPETIAMVLWGIDNIKTEGEAVAQVLWLLGVKPRRDSMNRATDIEVIPLEKLRRPRIDVVLTVSGIFRDLFGATMALLDKAVRQVAVLDE